MSPATNLVDKRQGTDADPFLKLLVLAPGEDQSIVWVCADIWPPSCICQSEGQIQKEFLWNW